MVLTQMPGETARCSVPYERLTGAGDSNLWGDAVHKTNAATEKYNSRINEITFF